MTTLTTEYLRKNILSNVQEHEVIKSCATVIMKCPNKNCVLREGLLEETVSSKEINHYEGNDATTLYEWCCSVMCPCCNTTQFVCSVCNVAFKRRRHLMQHVSQGKKHQALITSMQCAFVNEDEICIDESIHDPFDCDDLKPNQHLDSDLDSLNDDSHSVSSLNEGKANLHLDDDLNSCSDGSCSTVEEAYDSMNSRTKQAIERHQFVQDIKKMMSGRSSTPHQLAEEMDLLELRFVVGRALGFHDKAECLRIHPVDAARHVLFTSLMETLTESKREDVLLLLHLNTILQNLHRESKMWKKTELSSDINTLNKVNLKGTQSIKKALCLNEAKQGYGVAYSDVKDSVHSMMLQHGPMNSIASIREASTDKSVSRVIECRKIQRMATEMEAEAIESGLDPNEVVPVFITVWDDGFDNTAMKSGIGGLNMGTISVLDFKTGNMSRLSAFTDVISLSRSSDEHDESMGKLLSELTQLRKPFKTFHKTRGDVYAMVRLLNINRDRVQQNKISGTLNHNGRSNQRWQCVIPPKGEEREPFYSCAECFNQRVKVCIDGQTSTTDINNSCTACCDFEMGKNEQLQEVSIQQNCPTQLKPGSPMPPKEVPISTTNRKRRSFQLNYKMMRMALRTAVYNHILDFWSEPKTEAYLNEIGINKSTILKVLIFKKGHRNESREDVIRELHESSYDQVIPSVWKYDSISDISDNIDPLMHMVFEGIVKNMYNDIIPKALNIFEVGKQCMALIQNQLIAFRTMSVSWIRTEALSRKTLKPVGWRGVDLVAASKLLKNCISHVKDAILAKGGSKMESHLEKYMIFEQFVCSCHSMISRVMCDSCTDESINDVEHHIKLFLSASERYCKLVEKRDSKKTFLNMKGNYLSLLNVPGEMREYGPLRRYWDGDYEAFVKLIKDVLPGGLRRTGSATLVSKLRRFKERTSLVFAASQASKYLLFKKHIRKAAVYERNKPVHIYKSLQEVEQALQKNDPISGLLLLNEEGKPSIVIPYKVRSLKRIHERSEQGLGEQRLNCLMIHLFSEQGRWIAGSWYIPLGVKHRKAYEHTDITFSVLRRNLIRNLVLVPQISLQGVDDDDGMHCIMSDDWNELDSQTEFNLLNIQRHTFPQK